MSVRYLFVAVVIAAGCSRTPALPPDKAALRPIGVPVVAEVSPVLQTPGVQPATALAPVLEVPRLKPTPEDAYQPPILRPRETWTERETVAEALGRIGPAAVPALVSALQRPEAEARLQAIEVLGRMGPDAKDAVAELTRMLDDPDLRIRKAAARTLGLIGPEAAAAVPALMRSLVEPTPKVPDEL